MEFNPMMLLPLLTMLKGKSGGSTPDLTNILGLIAKMQSGDTSALLNELPADDKTKQLLSLMQLLPSLSGTAKPVSTTAAPTATTPPPNPLNIANNEINSALKMLLT